MFGRLAEGCRIDSVGVEYCPFSLAKPVAVNTGLALPRSLRLHAVKVVLLTGRCLRRMNTEISWIASVPGGKDISQSATSWALDLEMRQSSLIWFSAATPSMSGIHSHLLTVLAEKVLRSVVSVCPFVCFYFIFCTN